MTALPKEPPSREITPEALYLRRREFISNSAKAAGTAVLSGGTLLWLVGKKPPPDLPEPPDLVGAIPAAAPGPYDAAEPETSYRDATTYNNFYEFGTGKDDPARNAHTLQTRPWTVSIEGEVAKPQTLDIDTLLQWFPLEQRVYRMRCVEAWSMVIP